MRTYYVAGIPYSDTELNHMGVSDVQWDKSDELYHHGIKGQRWYKRRFVDYDGKLTPAGRRRYGIEEFQPAALKDNAGTQNGTKQSSLKETIKRQQAAGNQYGTRFSSAQRKNHIESPVGNMNRAANNTAAARKADMKATVAYNNSIPGRINAGINAGKEWLNQAGQNINNAASDAVNYFTGNRDYNNAMEKANEYQQQAINAGGDTKTIGDAGPNVEAHKALNNAERTMANAENQQPGFLRDITNVGNWIGDRARDAGNWVGDNLGIYNAANWVGDRASDVANYFTGNRDNAAAYNNAMEKANEYQQQAINAGGDTKTIGDAGPNIEAHKAMVNANNTMNNVEYQRPGFLRDITNVGNWIGDNLGIYNAANWVGDRARDAGSWVGQNVQNAGNWVGDRFSDAANWATGNRDREYMNRQINQAAANGDTEAMQYWQNQAANYAGPQMFTDIRNVGNWVGDRASDAANWLTGNRDYAERMAAAQYQPEGSQAYNAIVSDANRARANSVLGRVGQAAQDVGNWAGQVPQNVNNWIGDRADDVVRMSGNRDMINNYINNNTRLSQGYEDDIPYIVTDIDRNQVDKYVSSASDLRKQATEAFINGDKDSAISMAKQADIYEDLALPILYKANMYRTLEEQRRNGQLANGMR